MVQIIIFVIRVTVAGVSRRSWYGIARRTAAKINDCLSENEIFYPDCDRRMRYVNDIEKRPQ
jgi:hypothetical protein